uniref:AlNc14C157G7685 protein n=1 Tax=Albugo laibachii Nc14 TaxID=890382 RepID=F0WMJ5_9STRA|nr:AlNc14C157G7685 [Albugo laibachii Nc14]|eukprot:CCA22527.1 AlNc14C157G7685 [Albugo laibachii Nc14]
MAQNDTSICMRLKQCVSDPCMFVREGKQGSVLIVLYVDDLLIGCANESESAEIAANIAIKFQLNVLGDARFILGMEVQYDRNKEELILSQSQFIERMVEKFGRKEAHPGRIPSIIGQDFFATKRIRYWMERSRIASSLGRYYTSRMPLAEISALH